MHTAGSIKALKGRKKIVMLTAYDYTMSSLLEKAGVDMILVGDSLGMVFQGNATTLPVTVDEVIYHTKAVMKGAKKTMVVADMPFMSYQASKGAAKKNGGRVIKETGAAAVKLEGGADIIPQVKALVDAGIPVMGHIGMQPQSVKKYGGYPVFGRTPAEEKELVEAAKRLEAAGVFSLVIEKTAARAAGAVTKAVKIPVIGIGAGPECDGQVLVTHDMLGFFEDFKPKFVKRYERLAVRAVKAVKRFSEDVRGKKYPRRKYYF
ncbi:MAG TPA: 3-methyl-2-oxobutanoate hydroxymethyltransferase [bacterium]|nr:3-methyl-2-oxobutanoate hydroxymethyltransferase [bacterium]